MMKFSSIKGGLSSMFTKPVQEKEEPLKEGYLSPHFHESEFKCRHCKKLHSNGVPKELLDILEDVREQFGKPVKVLSGYRCPTHNRNVGGAKNSQHMRGIAADIYIEGVSSDDVFSYLAKHEGGLGWYPTFTHVDVRGNAARWGK